MTSYQAGILKSVTHKVNNEVDPVNVPCAMAVISLSCNLLQGKQWFFYK